MHTELVISPELGQQAISANTLAEIIYTTSLTESKLAIQSTGGSGPITYDLLTHTSTGFGSTIFGVPQIPSPVLLVEIGEHPCNWSTPQIRRLGCADVGRFAQQAFLFDFENDGIMSVRFSDFHDTALSIRYVLYTSHNLQIYTLSKDSFIASDKKGDPLHLQLQSQKYDHTSGSVQYHVKDARGHIYQLKLPVLPTGAQIVSHIFNPNSDLFALTVRRAI